MSQDDAVSQHDVRTAFTDGPPASFKALAPDNQKRKLAYRQNIETNWGCDIQDSIPLLIIPRQGKTSWTKIRIGEHGEERPWWLWSVGLLVKLRQLSKLTRHDLDRAQKLMLAQVTTRQTAEERHAGWDTAEIMATDVDAVIDALMKRSSKQNSLEISKVKRERVDSLEPEQFGESLDYSAEGQQPGMKQGQDKKASHSEGTAPFFDETTAATIQAPSPRRQTSAVSVTPSPLRKKQKTAQNTSSQEVAILKLRAKAMRHRQEAAQLEAEAYELEAKALCEDT